MVTCRQIGGFESCGPELKAQAGYGYGFVLPKEHDPGQADGFIEQSFHLGISLFTARVKINPQQFLYMPTGYEWCWCAHREDSPSAQPASPGSVVDRDGKRGGERRGELMVDGLLEHKNPNSSKTCRSNPMRQWRPHRFVRIQRCM